MLDHELLERIAAEMHVNVRLLDSIDEQHVPWLMERLEAFSSIPHVSESVYVRQLLEMILSLGARGQCIIVGRGAAHILPPALAIRVRLVAEFADRAQTKMREWGVTLDEAEGRVNALDERRRAFVRSHFHIDPTSPENYDLVLNTSRVDVETCSRLIMTVLERAARPGRLRPCEARFAGGVMTGFVGSRQRSAQFAKAGRALEAAPCRSRIAPTASRPISPELARICASFQAPRTLRPISRTAALRAHVGSQRVPPVDFPPVSPATALMLMLAKRIGFAALLLLALAGIARPGIRRRSRRRSSRSTRDRAGARFRFAIDAPANISPPAKVRLFVSEDAPVRSGISRPKSPPINSASISARCTTANIGSRSDRLTLRAVRIPTERMIRNCASSSTPSLRASI